MRATRILSATAVALALSLPAVAHATDMSGIVVIVAGMFVGVPAALLLAISIVVSLVLRARAKGPHPRYATAMTVAGPLLGVVYPLSLLLTGGRSEFVGVAAMFNLPVLVLAIVAVVLARRVG